MVIIHSHFYFQKDAMAFSSRRVASDNRESDQLQGLKTLPAGLTKNIYNRHNCTWTPKALRVRFRNLSSSCLGATEDRKCTHPLLPEKAVLLTEGCTTAERNSSDDSAMQGTWCFTHKVHDFDSQEGIFLSIVFRIWFCCVLFPLPPPELSGSLYQATIPGTPHIFY